MQALAEDADNAAAAGREGAVPLVVALLGRPGAPGELEVLRPEAAGPSRLRSLLPGRAALR